MAKQFADNWQALSHGDTMRSERVPEIVNANIFKVGCLSDATPRLLHVTQVLTVNIAYDDIWVTGKSGSSLEFLDSSLPQVDGLLARL